MNKERLITAKQAWRFPIYLNYLRNVLESGKKKLSVLEIATDCGLSQEEVNQDLETIEFSFESTQSLLKVDELINKISNFLGYNTTKNMIVIGVGSLGTSLIRYKELEKIGFKIVAGFEHFTKLVGTNVEGVPVYEFDDLEKILPKLNCDMAIICVPYKEAKFVLDKLIKVGIKAIWNFAPIFLKNDDENCVIENVYLNSSLATLYHNYCLKKDK